jgi:general secretion pathway protein I
MKRHARGFTLLEAIVAITVFSICAMALYGWLAVNVSALSRIDARSAAVRDGRAALAVLEPVNPMAEPSGSRSLPGGLEVQWDSTELQRRPGVGMSGSALIFDLGLYEMHVVVSRGGREEQRFSVRRAGWVTARTVPDDF